MRCYNLPYVATNPRTIRGARKKGWDIVQIDQTFLIDNNVSWVGLNIWCERTMSDYWVSSFQLRQFAFKNKKDSTFFRLKWIK